MKRGQMIRNKRGLSAVIVTLLLVMLSIVLVGIVFVVVSNVVNTSKSNISGGATCSYSGVEVTSATCNKIGTQCNVTVQRTRGSDEIGGVTLTFSNAAGDAASNSTGGNIITPAYKRISSIPLNPAVANVSSIGVSIYYNESSGKQYPCPGQNTFTNIALV